MSETVNPPGGRPPTQTSAHWRMRWRPHLIVLALYTLLTLVLTLPLILRSATHVPGVPQWAFDESTFLWNVWYFKEALVDELHSPLHSDLIWYPLGIDLILYTYNFFHAMIAQPLMVAVNLPFASNMALLLSTILSGYGTFLLVVYLLRKHTPTHRESTHREATHHEAINRNSIYLAAFGAGLLYAFASNRAIYAALGHYDMVTTQWIPFYALMLVRTLDPAYAPRQRYRAAALAGLFLAFNGLAEMITALFLGIFTLIVLLVKVPGWMRHSKAYHPTDGTAARAPYFLTSLLALLLLGGVTFVVWSPALLPILVQFLTDDFSLQGWGEAIPLSVDLLGWFTPTALHPVFGHDLVAELRRVQLRSLELGVTGFRDVNTVFLGWASAAIALTGALVYRRRVSLWLWTAGVFGILTLGPFLQINGRYRFDLDGVETAFPLPFALLHYLPIIKANRAPNRNSVLLMLALAVLVGFAFFWFLEKTKRSSASDPRSGPPDGGPSGASSGAVALRGSIVILLCALITFEHLALPLPLSDGRVPAVYHEIAADPDPVSVMHAPLGWRNSFGVLGPERTQLQYYQTVHGKPMLGGNISRAPDFKMDYFRRIPYFHALTELEFDRDVPPEVMEAARDQAADLVYLYNTGYVILMPPIPQRYPYVDTWQQTWDFVRDTLPLEPEPFWNEDGIEAYRVVQPQGSDSFTLDLGTENTYAYQGEGWDDAEVSEVYGERALWATDETSRVFLPLRTIDPAATYRVTVRAHPFTYPGSPPQSITLDLEPMGADAIAFNTIGLEPDGWQTITWDVPGSALVDGLNRLRFDWAHTASPRTALGGSRQIGETGVELPVDADLKAFADGAFIALFDEEGNQVDASAGRRGVNVTLLDPHSGDVLDQAGFDTAANTYESDALAEHLAGIEPGTIVLVATYGDATAFLTEAAVDGLRNLGLDVSLDQLQGQYITAVGVQGAAPGSALAASGETEAFLQVSLNRDRRTLAAAVDWVTVEPAE